jgi:RNA polymerase sigma-70 factor (ECF subfamily)
LKQRESLQPLLQLSTVEDEVQQIASPEPSPELLLAKQQMKEWLLKAVDQLEPTYREVYVLREIEEMSGEEVAKRLGLSLAAMKTRLHRARESVREFLDESLVAKSSNS